MTLTYCEISFPMALLAAADSTLSHTRSNVDAHDTILGERVISLLSSESLGGAIRRLEAELRGLSEECSELGWDGYNALPISHSSLQDAARFLRKYPRNWPMPEVAADPDGEISFNWTRGESHSFCFSIGHEGKLRFAGIFGPDEIHGKVTFGETIPEIVLSHVRNLFTKLS